MNLILKLFYWVYGFSNIGLILIIVTMPIFWRILHKLALEICRLNPKIWKMFCTSLLLVFIFCILYVTIGMRSSGDRIHNLIPFYSLHESSSGTIQSCLLNIVMVEPIGLLTPIVCDKKCVDSNIYIELLPWILFSVMIEAIQYFWQLGTAEIDDVIFNTLGYVIGRGSFFDFSSVLKR